MHKLSLASFLAVTTILAACSSGGSSDQTGGHSGSGGTATTGGSTTAPAGGATGAGGSVSDGGKSGNGGASASGGTGGTSGSTATGGSNAGGTVSAGGAAGGAVSAGGTTARGGAVGSGGVSGSGGVTGAGGGTTPAETSGYPAAGPSGQAKPTGSGTTVTVLPWAGFKGAVSFTFDDANQSQIDNYPALQKLNDKGNNVRYTFYVITGKTTEMASSVWPQALKDGHELANHTKSHAQTGTAADIDAAQTFLKSTLGITAYSFAAPWGDVSYPPLSVGKFLTNRSAGHAGNHYVGVTDDPDSGSPTAFRYNLPCYIPDQNASASAITGPVSEGQWAIILVHGFTATPQTDGAYLPVSITEFTSAVSSVKAKGTIWIDTMANIASYWIAGFEFAKLTPTTPGSDKTWTWKTSDFSPTFPPGKYLRVKTDGGTLKQGNTTLTWDDHGYYEVSLDAGTLTLSP
jgi:peptidoglycan/xylan/chitin deacetylase (PgdA/CDA1 family)